jgi:hypothetical protein
MMQSSSRVTVRGFSFGRDATTLTHPVEAAVQSALPLCDRFVFLAGRTDGGARGRRAGSSTASDAREASAGSNFGAGDSRPFDARP